MSALLKIPRGLKLRRVGYSLLAGVSLCTCDSHGPQIPLEISKIYKYEPDGPGTCELLLYQLPLSLLWGSNELHGLSGTIGHYLNLYNSHMWIFHGFWKVLLKTAWKITEDIFLLFLWKLRLELLIASFVCLFQEFIILKILLLHFNKWVIYSDSGCSTAASLFSYSIMLSLQSFLSFSQPQLIGHFHTLN